MPRALLHLCPIGPPRTVCTAPRTAFNQVRADAAVRNEKRRAEKKRKKQRKKQAELRRLQQAGVDIASLNKMKSLQGRGKNSSGSPRNRSQSPEAASLPDHPFSPTRREHRQGARSPRKKTVLSATGYLKIVEERPSVIGDRELEKMGSNMAEVEAARASLEPQQDTSLRRLRVRTHEEAVQEASDHSRKYRNRGNPWAKRVGGAEARRLQCEKDARRHHDLEARTGARLGRCKGCVGRRDG